MSGHSRFITRVVAASIGLLGAVSAQAVPMGVSQSGGIPSRIWSDPVEPYSALGIIAGKANPAASFGQPERFEYERQIEALDDISARLQSVLDDVALLADDLAEIYAIETGDIGPALMSAVDRFRSDREAYVSTALERRTERPAAPYDGSVNGLFLDTSATAETALAEARRYVVMQEMALGSFKAAIQRVYSAGPAGAEAISEAMAVLVEAIDGWSGAGVVNDAVVSTAIGGPSAR